MEVASVVIPAVTALITAGLGWFAGVTAWGRFEKAVALFERMPDAVKPEFELLVKQRARQLRLMSLVPTSSIVLATVSVVLILMGAGFGIWSSYVEAGARALQYLNGTTSAGIEAFARASMLAAISWVTYLLGACVGVGALLLGAVLIWRTVKEEGVTQAAARSSLPPTVVDRDDSVSDRSAQESKP